MYRIPNRSMGPAVVYDRDAQNYRALCSHSQIYCVFSVSSHCTHVKPSKKIEQFPETPDWCEMKASAIQDAKDQEAMRKLGLFGKSRSALQAMARDFSHDVRPKKPNGKPKPLSHMQKHELQYLILRAAQEEGWV